MINKYLIEQLKRHEDLRLMPYMDTTGHISIGYGRNLTDNGISLNMAEAMLAEDLNIAIKELFKTRPLVSELNLARQNVLINMAFNLGMPKLMKFHKMWKALAVENFDEAAVQMLDSLWAKQVGYRAEELAHQMKTGVLK